MVLIQARKPYSKQSYELPETVMLRYSRAWAGSWGRWRMAEEREGASLEGDYQVVRRPQSPMKCDFDSRLGVKIWGLE